MGVADRGTQGMEMQVKRKTQTLHWVGVSIRAWVCSEEPGVDSDGSKAGPDGTLELSGKRGRV